MRIHISVPFSRVEEAIERVAGLGLGIEVYFDNHTVEDTGLSEVRSLGAMLKAYGVPCTVHAPFMDLSPGGYDRAVVAHTRSLLKKSAAYATELDALNMVCHPGFDMWRFVGNEKFWLEGSITTWTEVLAETGTATTILLENVFEERPDNLIALLGHFSGKNIGFCFDSGHFNLFSKISLYEWIMPIKDRLYEMHLHDNKGISDDHMPVGAGTFPFRELKQIMKSFTTKFIPVAEIHGADYAIESVKRLREFLG